MTHIPPNDDEDGVTAGRVKEVHSREGYTFLTCPEIPVDIFLHQSAHREQHVKPGDRVTFGYKRALDGRYRATRILTVEAGK